MSLLNDISKSADPGTFGALSKIRDGAMLQEGTSVKLVITLSVKKVAWILTAIVLTLTFLSVAGHTIQYFLGRDQFFELVRLFNLGDEQNIPTWYTSASLLLCAMFLAYITVARKKLGLSYIAHWGALSAIFLYLSIDSVATIHDRTIERPLIELLHPRGFVHFPWVIPGIIVVILLAVLYSRFLFHLPVKTRFLFIIAAAAYIGGGLILEMVSAYLMDYYVQDILLRGFVATLQEFLEMAGVIIFIYALLSYIGLLVNTGQVAHESQQSDLSLSKEQGSS